MAEVDEWVQDSGSLLDMMGLILFRIIGNLESEAGKDLCPHFTLPCMLYIDMAVSNVSSILLLNLS